MGKPRNQFTFYRSYYDAIQALSKRDQSALILAVCAYGIYETEPKGLSNAAITAFNLIKPTLDSGRKKAESGALGGQASGKPSESKTEANHKQNGSKPQAKYKQGENARENEGDKEYKIDIDIDVEADGEGNSLADYDADYNELKIIGGKLGKGVVKLSKAQMDALLDKIGFDMFNYYVERLADYIIESGVVIHNHYETILKWWEEDRKV